MVHAVGDEAVYTQSHELCDGGGLIDRVAQGFKSGILGLSDGRRIPKRLLADHGPALQLQGSLQPAGP